MRQFFKYLSGASCGALFCGLLLGVSGCFLVDDDSEDSYGDEESCEEPDVIPFTGMLHTSEGTIEFDTVDVYMLYGSLNEPCVTEVTVWLRKSNEYNCTLMVSASDYLDGSGALVVDYVSFDGSGACPGFPETMQSDYSPREDLVGSVTVGAVDPGDFGCHEDAITVSISGSMAQTFSWGHEDAVPEFVIEGAEFVIEGPLYASDEPSSCPVAR